MDYGDEPFPFNRQADAWMREAERLKKQVSDLRVLATEWETDGGFLQKTGFADPADSASGNALMRCAKQLLLIIERST